MEYSNCSEEYQDRIDLLNSEKTKIKFPFIKEADSPNLEKILIPALSKERKEEIDFAISQVDKLHAF